MKAETYHKSNEKAQSMLFNTNLWIINVYGKCPMATADEVLANRADKCTSCKTHGSEGFDAADIRRKDPRFPISMLEDYMSGSPTSHLDCNYNVLLSSDDNVHLNNQFRYMIKGVQRMPQKVTSWRGNDVIDFGADFGGNIAKYESKLTGDLGFYHFKGNKTYVGGLSAAEEFSKALSHQSNAVDRGSKGFATKGNAVYVSGDGNLDKRQNSFENDAMFQYGIERSNLSDSGTTGMNFKFTQHSKQAELMDFKAEFVNSKCFLCNPSVGGDFNLIMVSCSKNYHPQFRICQINRGENSGGKYQELEGYDKGYGYYGTKYELQKECEYVVEIGCTGTHDFSPFENFTEGGFICCLSAEKDCLQNILGKSPCKVKLNQKECNVPFEQGKELGEESKNPSSCPNQSPKNSPACKGDISQKNGVSNLETENTENGSEKTSCGKLDYSCTPYFDESKGCISLYFKYNDTVMTDFLKSSKGCSTVEIKCNIEMAEQQYIEEGIEESKNMFKFTARSNCVCDLIKALQ